MTLASPNSVNETVRSDNAEVTFQSCDGILFHIHSKNLDVATGGFPSVGLLSPEEPVPLTESGAVLELLFQFVYPKRHPDLEDLGFPLVSALAEASEKYEVFPAMNVCRRRMRDFISDHAVEVCLYAARHDYPDLIKLTASHAISLPLSTVIPLLPSRLIVPWLQYHESWMKIYNSILNYKGYRHTGYPNYSNVTASCNTWFRVSLEVFHRLQHQNCLEPLQCLDTLFTPPVASSSTASLPQCCKDSLQDWKMTTKKAIDKIPKFECFIKENLRM